MALLDNIHGYTKIADIHLDNLECTNNEKNILLANLQKYVIMIIWVKPNIETER